MLCSTLSLKSVDVSGICGVKVKLVTSRSKTAQVYLADLLAIMELMSCRVAISVLELLRVVVLLGVCDEHVSLARNGRRL
jgi:hypothetical protein